MKVFRRLLPKHISLLRLSNAWPTKIKTNWLLCNTVISVFFLDSFLQGSILIPCEITSMQWLQSCKFSKQIVGLARLLSTTSTFPTVAWEWFAVLLSVLSTYIRAHWFIGLSNCNVTSHRRVPLCELCSVERSAKWHSTLEHYDRTRRELV